jgi:hypothetical protein
MISRTTTTAPRRFRGSVSNGRRAPFVLGVLALGVALPSSAQTVIAQWNANNASGGSSTFLVPSSGINAATGLAAGYGQSNPPAPFSTILTTGSPADPGTDVSGTTYNLSYVVNPPLTSTSNNSVGLSFKVSTVGMSAGQGVQVSWSQTVGWRSSRYWQILATTDGTNWSPVPTGAGSSLGLTINGLAAPSPYTPISGSATVTVSDSGLIDFRTINQNSLLPVSTTTDPSYDVGFVNGITFTFPTGQGFENNADFGFAIVGAFDPSYGGTDGTQGYVSSFAGLASTDTVNGYNRSASQGGSMRLDLVTVTAVPEPSALASLFGTLALAGVLLRRRRSAP